MGRRNKMEDTQNLSQTEVTDNVEVLTSAVDLYKPVTGEGSTVGLNADGQITFELFSKEGRGKKAVDKDTCYVTVEPIDFNSLSDKAKAELLVGLMKSVARSTHAKMNAGYNQLAKYLADAEQMIIDNGYEVTDEARTRMAQNLAKRDEVILAFEPVTKIHLSAATVLEEANK